MRRKLQNCLAVSSLGTIFYKIKSLDVEIKLPTYSIFIIFKCTTETFGKINPPDDRHFSYLCLFGGKNHCEFSFHLLRLDHFELASCFGPPSPPCSELIMKTKSTFSLKIPLQKACCIPYISHINCRLEKSLLKKKLPQ